MKTTTEPDTLESVAEEHNLSEEAFRAYCDNMHIRENYAESVADFEEYYIGEMSVREYAEELADDIFSECVKSGYFDYDSFARDLELGGDVYEYNGHLFRNY